MILLRILSLTALIVVAGVIAADSAHGPAGADLPTTSTSTTSTSTTSTTSTSTTSTSTTSTTTPARTEPGEDRWDQLAQCESGQRWDANTGNGYGGALQFAHTAEWSTWRAFGGTEFAADPWDATREQQIIVAERVLARSGWGAWPACSRRLGFR